jgi:hypothetical protein
VPNFLSGSKNKNRKEFYRDIFNNQFRLTPTENLWRELNALTLDIPKEAFFKDRVSFGHMLNTAISIIKYLMIDQTLAKQKNIARLAAKKITVFLQQAFKEKYPLESKEGQDEYWLFITSALEDCMLVDFNGDEAKQFIEASNLYECLYQKTHPRLKWNFLDRLEAMANLLNLDAEAKRTALDCWKDSEEKILHAYSEITNYIFPFYPALIGVGAGAAAVCLGMPYIALAICTVDVIGITRHAFSIPEYSQKSADFFLIKGKQSLFDAHGLKINTNIPKARNYVITEGVKSIHRQLRESHKIQRKIIPSTTAGEAPREIFVSSYENLPNFSDITETQRKKIKGKKSVIENKTSATVDVKEPKIRHISLPKNVIGTVIECANDALIVIQPPSPRSDLSSADIEEMMGPRGANVATKYGRSGVKILTNHGFWIKDKNTHKRVTLEPQADVTVIVDGNSQTVPAFKPTRMINKRD